MRHTNAPGATGGNEMQRIEADGAGEEPPLDALGPGLSVKQRMAVLALVQGDKVAEAARSVGVDRVTVWRWMREPEFAAEFEAACDGAYRQALREMQGAALEASDVLRGLMRASHPAIRLRAAQAVLSLAFRAREGAAEEEVADKRRAEEREFDRVFGR